MPRLHAPTTPLDQRIGRALLRGRDDEGVLAVEDGVVVACNAAAAELLGRPCPAEGADFEAFLRTVDGEILHLHFHSVLLDDGPAEFVVERPGRPGEWLEVRALALSPGLVFFLKDVTERELGERSARRKEQRLLAANRSLRLAHAAARAASWEWRVGRALRWLDLAAARDLGCLPIAWTEDEEIVDWRSLIPLPGRRTFDRAIARLADVGQASFEIEVTGADGGRHWMRIDCAVTERDSAGAPGRISGVTVDVTQSKRAAEALRREIANRKRSEERQQLLVHELNHRVKNMLATVQSVARQSLAGPGLGPAAQEFEERLMALVWAYDILTRESWEGALLREVIERTLAPHAGRASERLVIEGPDLRLTPNRALAFAMALHELATNAVKYGALSNETGRVEVRWRIAPEPWPGVLELEWVELGGPPVAPPSRRGFGSRLVERSLARELGGEARLAFEPGGLQCRIKAPLDDPAG